MLIFEHPIAIRVMWKFTGDFCSHWIVNRDWFIVDRGTYDIGICIDNYIYKCTKMELGWVTCLSRLMNVTVSQTTTIVCSLTIRKRVHLYILSIHFRPNWQWQTEYWFILDNGADKFNKFYAFYSFYNRWLNYWTIIVKPHQRHSFPLYFSLTLRGAGREREEIYFFRIHVIDFLALLLLLPCSIRSSTIYYFPIPCIQKSIESKFIRHHDRTPPIISSHDKNTE